VLDTPEAAGSKGGKRTRHVACKSESEQMAISLYLTMHKRANTHWTIFL
jgi:hypothetical protein